MGVEFHPWHLLVAYLLDLIIGDPPWMPHPVRWIGNLISFIERRLYPLNSLSSSKHWKLVTKGGFLVGLTILITLGVYGLVIHILPRPLSDFFNIWLAFTLIATKSLHTETAGVIKVLEQSSIEEARKKLSWLVSRDTEKLDREGILKATIETLSENISDGIIAPLFYLGLGGPLLGLLYKTVNTLDSMVGYRNERYLYFGKIAARVDDIMNFIPARLSGALIIFSAWILQRFRYDVDWRRGLFIMRRDGHLLSSPNAGIPQSAMAGVIGVKLGGVASYFGKTVEKPTIGDSVREISNASYRLAVGILYLTSLAGLLLAIGLRAI
ncbi:MAG: adenosylcobinamide-phosphate synthase CbiB [Syntrophobacterales bacterium]|nr:adenosylcobinamide-phosphate synthase CbiB [Syntrophobacterales bacterium]